MAQVLSQGVQTPLRGKKPVAHDEVQELSVPSTNDPVQVVQCEADPEHSLQVESQLWQRLFWPRK